MKSARMTIGGIPVIDAVKPLQIQVTPADVKDGKTKEAGSCAAALAARRHVAGCMDARVHRNRTYIKMQTPHGVRWLRYHTPDAVRTEVVSFDRAGIFEPGEFTFRPIGPAERNRRGKRQGSNAKGARDKGSKDRTPKFKRAKPHEVAGVRPRGANR